MPETAVHNWAIVKIDETQYWNLNPDPVKYWLKPSPITDALKAIKRIFGVYVTDLNKQVHCCELTPSYELNFIETQYELDLNIELTDEQLELISDYIMDGDRDTDLVRYYHCKVLEGAAKIDTGCYPDNMLGVIELGAEDDSEDDEQDIIDRYTEWVRGNSI